ncbi:MAG: DUF3035 domain-containing protein [Alphaproteobacteria bacterium]
MSASRSLFILGLTALLLSACAETRQDLGLGRNPPDEFAVLERPPLSMPPDYALHPPRPGEARPQTVDVTQRASETLFEGNAPTQTNAPSNGEKALLAQAGATKADPNIRQTVDHETSEKVVASPHLVDRLTNWSDDKPATTVDAQAEADRIKAAKDNNQPVTQGATPVIEKQSSGWLGL